MWRGGVESWNWGAMVKGDGYSVDRSLCTDYRLDREEDAADIIVFAEDVMPSSPARILIGSRRAFDIQKQHRFSMTSLCKQSGR